MTSEELLQRRIVAALVMLVPWAMFALTWLMTPSYISPMLNHPATIPGTVTAGLLTALFFWVLQSTQSKLIWILVILLFVVPMCLVPLIGPAPLTIIKA